MLHQLRPGTRSLTALFPLLFLTLLSSAQNADAAPFGSLDILRNLTSFLGIGTVANPLADVIQSWFSGVGLQNGVLGALEGLVGASATYDYVIVGGGTAGNAMAYRLAEAGFQVAVIEAGGFYEIGKPVLGTTPAGDIIGIGASMADSNPLVDWKFQTEPQAGANNRRMHYLRGKALGGSSTVSFMVYHRGTRGAYQRWADEVGDDSYTFDNFNPYFEKAVHFTPPNNEKRGANVSTQYDPSAFPAPNNGPIAVSYSNYISGFTTWFEKAAQGIGLKSNTQFSSGSLFGYHYAQVNMHAQDQTRSSSADYIYKANDRGFNNLKVYTRTLASKILFDSNKTATGVQVSTAGISYTIKAAREVIVSAGSFQSPQVLMVSGIGPKSTLDKFNIPVLSNLAGVGQNMWDHTFFGTAREITFNTLAGTLYNPVLLAQALVDYVGIQEGPLTSNLCEWIAWLKAPAKYRNNYSAQTLQALAQFPDDWPEFELLPANGFLGDFSFPLLQQPIDGKQVATVLAAMVAPTSRGNVTIKSSSTTDLPLINPNWLTTKADQEQAIAWYRFSRDLWETPELKSITRGGEYFPGAQYQSDEQILDVIRGSMQTVWHAAGTNKMGKQDDPMAVVDSKARVYGVQGLRVVDASAFPLLPPGHPLGTIYALAEKISEDIIKGR